MSYLLRTVRAVKLDLLLARIRRGDITNVSFNDLVRRQVARLVRRDDLSLEDER